MKLRILAAVLMISAISSNVSAMEKQRTTGEFGRVLEPLVEIQENLSAVESAISIAGMEATNRKDLNARLNKSKSRLDAYLSQADEQLGKLNQAVKDVMTSEDFRKTANAWAEHYQKEITRIKDSLADSLS